jgi:hypothetical protein
MIHKLIVPDSREVNISFIVPENYIGEEMEVIAFIKKEGMQPVRSSENLSPSLQGNPMTNEEFLNWIENAETMETVSLKDAKNQWAKKRNHLQKLMK